MPRHRQAISIGIPITRMIATHKNDSNGPTNKRRRPALSCVECRQKKVRCDRNNPCGRCLQSNSATCTYTTSTVSSAENPPQQEVIVDNPLARKCTSPAQVETLSPGGSRVTQESPRIILPDSEASEHVWHSDAQRKVEELVDRVRQLEQIRLDSNLETPAAAPSVSAPQTHTQATRETLIKGKTAW